MDYSAISHPYHSVILALKRKMGGHVWSYTQFFEYAQQESQIGNSIPRNILQELIVNLFNINCDFEQLIHRAKHIKNPSVEMYLQFTEMDHDFSMWSTDLQRILATFLYR